MPTPIRSDELKWLGIDFDKVTSNSGEAPTYEMGAPMPGAVDSLRDLDKKGWKICIFTSRHWADVRPIEEWCEFWGIPVKSIICGKPLFAFQVDDRAIEFDPKTPEESWKRAVDKIGTFGEVVKPRIHVADDPALANVCDDCQ